jgi:hypothetical protein
MKDPPAFFMPELFPVGDTIDEIAVGTPLRFAMEEYLLHHHANLQENADQLIRDALAGIDVRKQLIVKPVGRERRPTSRTLALATEHARLVKNGIKKATATKVIIRALKADHGERGDDAALSKEIRRAIQEFSPTPSDAKRYESKLKALNLL